MAAADSKAIDVIIGKLLTVADVISKTVISAYSPRVGHSTNLTKMSGAKFSLPSLECCADFLGVQLKNANDTAKFSSKAALADRVILAIEALFPQHCGECEADYAITFDSEENPPILCFACFQGSHNCTQIREKLDVLTTITNLPSGFVWLCHGCKAKINPVKPSKRTRTVSVSNSVSNNVSRAASAANTPKQNTQPPPLTEEDLQQRLPNIDRRFEEQAEQTNGDSTKVCPRYKTRNCSHGKDGKELVAGVPCPFRHPKLCHKYCGHGTNLRFGCTKGKRCEFFHPRLCKNSLQDKHCPLEDCTFTHLKGTARGPDRPRRPSSRETQPPLYPSRGRSNPAAYRAAGENARPRPRTTSRAAEIGPEGKRTASSSNIDNNVHFLQIMGLVTSMQEDFRKEIAELKSSLSRLSPVPVTLPKPLYTPQQSYRLSYPMRYPQSYPQSYPQQYC